MRVEDSFSRRQVSAKVLELASKVTQAHDGAQRVERLLRSRGVDPPVKPILLFTGSDAPYMPPGVQHSEVTSTSFNDPTAWLQGAVIAGGQLDLDTA